MRRGEGTVEDGCSEEMKGRSGTKEQMEGGLETERGESMLRKE